MAIKFDFPQALKIVQQDINKYRAMSNRDFGKFLYETFGYEYYMSHISYIRKTLDCVFIPSSSSFYKRSNASFFVNH